MGKTRTSGQSKKWCYTTKPRKDGREQQTRGCVQQLYKKGTRFSVLEDDDRRLQRVMEYLGGTWGVDDLARKIRREFKCTRHHPALSAVAQELCDLHCVNGTYSCNDVGLLLERVVLSPQ